MVLGVLAGVATVVGGVPAEQAFSYAAIAMVVSAPVAALVGAALGALSVALRSRRRVWSAAGTRGERSPSGN